MKLNELIKEELQHEVALTKKFLQRIPQDKMDYQPHSKSMSLKQLGNHLSEIPAWVAGTMSQDKLNVAEHKSPQHESVEEMIKDLEKNAEAAYQSLENKANDEFNKIWSMVRGEEQLMSMPKYQVLRKMVLPQLPHHRAQLGTYLRLLEESVPSAYGPSADEQ